MEICSRSLFMYAMPPVGGEKGGGTRSEKGEAMLKEVRGMDAKPINSYLCGVFI